MRIAQSDFSLGGSRPQDCANLVQVGRSVGQPLCHFVTPPPSGGDYANQAKFVQDDGEDASKAYAKLLGGLCAVLP